MVFLTVKKIFKFFMDFYGLYRNRWQAGFDLQTVVCQLL